MKLGKTDGSRRRLALRKESLRRLDVRALDRVGGGKQAQPAGDFDLAEYLRRCMGTNYYDTIVCGY